MGKKQKRTPKKNSQNPANNALNAGSVSETATGSTFCKPLSLNELTVAIAILLGFVVYLVAFLFVKTEFGDRFGTYLVLLLNQDIYWAFWTGEPNGSFHLFDRWPLFLGLTFHLLIANGLGFLILRLLFKGPLTILEQAVLATGVGLAWISTYTVVVGVMHLYFLKQVLVLPLLIPAAIGWQKILRGSSVVRQPVVNKENHWTKWLWTACVPFAVFMLLGSMIPPWEFDVREYHLQVPKEWFLQGGVTFLPHNVYGNMPLGTEMHALFAMLYCFGGEDWWWGALIGKTVSGVFPILNTAVLYCLGRRLAGDFAGAAAALIYCSTPWTIANGIIGYNEGALGCYVSLAVLSGLLFWKSEQAEEDPERSTLTFLLFGQFVGAAVACKYTAIPFVAFPFLAVGGLWIFWRQGHALFWRFIAWTTLGILLVSAIWFLKNLFWTGNPVYPLVESVFDTSRTEIQAAQWDRAHAPNPAIPSLANVLAILNTLIFSFKWLSPLAIPFFIVSFTGSQKRAVILTSGYLLFVFLTWLFLTHRLERFLLPFYVFVCLGAGLGAQRIEKSAWRNVAAAILLLGCGMNFLFGTSRLIGDVRVFTSLQKLDLRKSTAKDYFHHEGQIVPLNHLSPTIAWLNENQPDAKVLFFGECRPLTARFDVIYNTCFDRCETWKRFSQRGIEEVRQGLAADSITHIFVNVSELRRLQSTYGYNVDDGGHPVDLKDLQRLEGDLLQRVNESPATTEADPGVILYQVQVVK